MLEYRKIKNGLPYGWIGVLAALQFAIWFFLRIEGTALAAEECRSTARSLPMGTLIGMVTLEENVWFKRINKLIMTE